MASPAAKASMPKLATGANKPKLCSAASPCVAPGFTLVEVLVVVIIAGILTGTVLLVVVQSGPAQTHQRELDRLRVSLEVMCDQALLEGAARGLRFHALGYDFWRYRAGQWQALPPDTGTRPVRWPIELYPRVQVEGLMLRPAPNQGAPQVICTGIEPPTALHIEIGSGEHRRAMSWPG